MNQKEEIRAIIKKIKQNIDPNISREEQTAICEYLVKHRRFKWLKIIMGSVQITPNLTQLVLGYKQLYTFIQDHNLLHLYVKVYRKKIKNMGLHKNIETILIKYIAIIVNNRQAIIDDFRTDVYTESDKVTTLMLLHDLLKFSVFYDTVNTFIEQIAIIVSDVSLHKIATHTIVSKSEVAITILSMYLNSEAHPDVSAESLHELAMCAIKSRVNTVATTILTVYLDHEVYPDVPAESLYELAMCAIKSGENTVAITILSMYLTHELYPDVSAESLHELAMYAIKSRENINATTILTVYLDHELYPEVSVESLHELINVCSPSQHEIAMTINYAIIRYHTSTKSLNIIKSFFNVI